MFKIPFMIKNMLKRRKESGTYLATDSSDVHCQLPGRCRSLSFFLTFFLSFYLSRFSFYIKIPFSGHSKVIDLVQVTGLKGFVDLTKKIPPGLCLLVHCSPQAKPYKRCIVFYKKVGKRKKIFCLF